MRPTATAARSIAAAAAVVVTTLLVACGDRAASPLDDAALNARSAASSASAAAGAAESCDQCHRRLHPDLVRAHESGPHHGKASCDDCHGRDHEKIFSIAGQVSSAACGRCHAARYTEFQRSKHGRLLKGGSVDDTLRAHASAVGGCNATNGCHSVQRKNDDGSVGSCAACHVSHAFTRGEASSPAICARCHSGPDHPQWEAWRNDKHGVLFAADPKSGLAPSCADCHMPAGTHDDSAGLTSSVVERPGERRPTLVAPLARSTADAARASMVAVCARCHGKHLAERTLASADDARFDALLLCEEAAKVVRDLDAEGLLVPAPRDRTENPLADGKLVLGGKQIYDERASRAERLFYDLFMFDFPALWRAAYHTDPDLVRWTVRERMKTKLIELRAEAERLRSAARDAAK